jgi:hypothetical protein
MVNGQWSMVNQCRLVKHFFDYVNHLPAKQLPLTGRLNRIWLLVHFIPSIQHFSHVTMLFIHINIRMNNTTGIFVGSKFLMDESMQAVNGFMWNDSDNISKCLQKR